MESTTVTKKSRAPTRRVKDTPLAVEDWIQAAMDILVRENVRGIKLDRLCADLGVTKGSFYWHFKTRSDLLKAMLDAWRRRMTLNVIESTMQRGGSAADRLKRLLVLPRSRRARGVAAIEQSIREWARRSDDARQTVNEVDQLRLNYMEALLAEMGLDPKVAQRNAYFAYCIVMGDSVIHDTAPELAAEGNFPETVIALLLDHTTPDPS
jgi:AcrR family transcriptional regulator